MNQMDLFPPTRQTRLSFLDLRPSENKAVERIRSFERKGRYTDAADEMSAITMRRLEVARVNGWSPKQREIGCARCIGGFNR